MRRDPSAIADEFPNSPSDEGQLSPDQTRIDTVLQQMDIAAIDVLICRLPHNVLMLSGYWPSTGNTFVLFPRLGAPVLITPEEEIAFAFKGWISDIRTYSKPVGDSIEDAVRPLLQDIAQEKGLGKLVIGYEARIDEISSPHPLFSGPGAATYLALRAAFPAADLHDATEALNRAQMIKTEREMAAIRRATEIARFGLAAAEQLIAPGSKEARIAGAIIGEVWRNGVGFKGVQRVHALCRVASGPRTSNFPSVLLVASDRVLQAGDPVIVEISVCADGFWSKLTRTFFAGAPSTWLQAYNDACLDALAKAIEAIGSGVEAREVTASVRQYVAQRGLATFLKDHLGHGIGFTLSPSSRPRFTAESDDVLQPFIVHTLEIGLFNPGQGGVKLGDVVADLGCGAEKL